MKERIEIMDVPTRHEQSQFGCDWHYPFSNLDCAVPTEVWVVTWDGYEWLAYPYCRPHGNLVLIAKREAQRDLCPECGVGLNTGEYEGMWEHESGCLNANIART